MGGPKVQALTTHAEGLENAEPLLMERAEKSSQRRDLSQALRTRWKMGTQGRGGRLSRQRRNTEQHGVRVLSLSPDPGGRDSARMGSNSIASLPSTYTPFWVSWRWALPLPLLHPLSTHR